MGKWFPDGDYVLAPVSAESTLEMDTEMTLAAWIKPMGAGSGNGHGGIIISKEREYQIARFSDGTLQWSVANSSPGWLWQNTGYVIPLNRWTHIALVYSSNTQTAKTYANGELIHTVHVQGEIGHHGNAAQDSFRIGGREALSQYFDGVIDEVYVYDRALSEQEVAALADHIEIICHVPSTHFSTIQSAVDTPICGTITLDAATYSEGQISVHRTVTIRGVGAGATIIEPAATPSLVFHNSNHQLTLENMTIRNGQTMRYRNGPIVDSSDTLPDGRRFHNIDEYKRLLLDDKEIVARSLATKLMEYATGATPTTADQREINSVVQRIREKNYGMRSLIHEVVQSRIFQHK